MAFGGYQVHRPERPQDGLPYGQVQVGGECGGEVGEGRRVMVASQGGRPPIVHGHGPFGGGQQGRPGGCG